MDAIYLCRDVNARLGSKQDFITEIDNIPHHYVIEKVCNKHGNVCHDFLLDSKFCIVNGRISPEFNNFTSISPKGSAVVDYFMVPIDNLSTCKQFKVHTARNLRYFL